MSNEQKSANVLVLELVNQQPSNFFLDGASEESELPSNISAPNARKLKSISKVVYEEYDEKAKRTLRKLKTIRYIKGCDEIDVKIQDEMGVKPNPSQDTIWILNGKLTVIESGSDIGLYRFLKSHENNVSNPDRPDGAVDVFKEIDTAIETMEVETLLDEESKILAYMNGLKRKMGQKFVYNDDALSFLCSLFKLPAYSAENPSEAWVNVALFAKENPRRFLSGLANQKSLVESEVNQALAKGVLTLNQTQVLFTEGRKVIMGVNSNLTTEEQVNQIVDFMCNPRNRLYYDNLRSGLHAKNTSLSSVVE